MGTKVEARFINGQTRYFGEDGKEYTPQEIMQRNTLTPSSGESIVNRVSDFLGYDVPQNQKFYRGYQEKPTSVDDFMNSNPSVDTSNAESGYNFFKTTNADNNQKIENAALKFDIPQNQLLLSEPETQNEAVKKSETPEYDFAKLAEESPRLFKKLGDPAFVAVTHDDISNLKEVEGVGTQIANAFELAQKENQLNQIDFKALNEGKKFDELDEQTKEERRKLVARINTLRNGMPKGFFTVSNFANLASNMLFDFSEAAKYASGGAVAGGIAGSLIPGIGNLAGASFGLAAGGKVGLVRAGQVRAAAESYRKQLAKGRDVGDAERGAQVAGLFGGILNYPFVNSIFRSRLIDTATKTGVLKQIGANTAEQSFIGAAAGLGEVISDKEASGNMYSWNADDAYTIAGSAASMAFLGTLLSTPGYAWAGLHELGKKIDLTSLKKRNPEQMEKFVNEVVPGDISIDSDRVMDYLSTLDEEQAASVLKKMNVSVEALQSAVQTGEKIHMSTGQFMNLDPKEREAFYGDVSMNDIPSAREVQEEMTNGPLEYPEEDLSKTPTDTESIKKDVQEYQNERTSEIDAEVEQEPLYLASNLLEGKPNEEQTKMGLKFNLQLFGHKSAKEVSKDFQGGKLTPEAEQAFEEIAQRYGYSSGSELAADILKKRTKEEEKTARVKEMVETTERENGIDAEGITAREEANDENLKKLSEQAESIKSEVTLDKMEADESTTPETITKNLDVLDSAVEQVVEPEKKKTLRARLAEVRKQVNERWKEKNAETREKNKQKIADIRAGYKEQIKDIRAKKDQKISDVRELYKGKLKDQKEQYKEKLESQKEKYEDKLAKEKAEKSEIIKNRKETINAYNILLKEIRAETKDTRERRAARMGTLSVTDAKVQARDNLSKLPQSQARNVSRLRAMSRRANALAERMYRKAVGGGLPTVKEASATKGTNIKPEDNSQKKTTAFTTGNPDWAMRNAEKDRYLSAAIKEKNRAILLSAMAQEAIKVNDRYNARLRKIHKIQVQLGQDRKKAHKNKQTISKNEFGYNQLGFLLKRFGVPAKGFKPVFDTLENLDRFANRMAGEGISPFSPYSNKSRGRGVAPYTFNSAEFNAFIDALDSKLGAARIPDWIRNDEREYKFSELTEQQADDFVNTLTNIKKMLNEESKMISDKKRRDINLVQSKMVEELNKNPNNFRPQDEKRNSLKNIISRLWHDQFTMDTLIHILTPNSKELRDFFINKKQYLDGLESTEIAKYSKKYREILSKYSKKELRDNYNKKIFLESLGMNATKQQLIAIALNLGNAGNREKLLNTKPVDFQDANNWNLKNIMDELETHLTKKDWETVQQLWDLTASLEDKIIEHEIRVTGFAPEMVKPEPFMVYTEGAYMKMRGGYIPLKSDFRDANSKAGMEDINTDNFLKNPVSVASTKHGFTKERTNAQYAVSLEPGIVINHIMDVLHDYYFRDYIADANRLLDPKGELYGKIYQKGGKAAVDDFRNYILSIAGAPDKRDVGEYGVNALFSWMKKSSAFSSIAFNFGVMTQNLANVFLYSGAVKGFNSLDVAAGLIKYGMFNSWVKSAYNWRGFETYIQKELSPYMLERYNRPDITLRAFENNVVAGQQSRFAQATDQIAEFSGKLMWFTDSLVSIPMWLQARDKKLKETGNIQEAMQYADTLIRRVNGSSNKSDNSRFMQAKSNTAYGMLNTFMGFFNAEANRWIREVYDVTGRDISTNIRNLPSFLAFAASHMLLFSLASNLLMFKEPNDNQDWGDYILSGALEEPVQNFPIVKDIVPALIERSLGGESFAYRPPISFSIPAQALTTGDSMLKYMTNDDPRKDDEKFERMAEQTTRLLSQVTRLPRIMSNVFWNAYDYDQNNITDWQFTDFIRRRPKEERK